MAGRLVYTLALFLGAASLLAAPAGRIQFNRDVRPVLSENCFQCHGTDENKRKADLRLDQRAAALKDNAIVPGKPDESELVARIFTSNADYLMPPADSHRQLTSAQKQLLRDWIAQGAEYESHWAFTPPSRPPLPPVRGSGQVRNPIDRFVLARLASEGLKPSAEAPLPTLLRRVSLDLTGLPPTDAQLSTWQKQPRPFEAAVEDLLASPHFGERMAVDWMDVARYADTHGFNNDSLRTMWRWRDWVIEAFNKNMPYNQFIKEQLAGDLLKNPTTEQLIATGFNRNHVINSEGGIIDEEYRVEYVADRLQTTATAWMGLTIGCARCHDHKFDPISQREYFRMFAFFNNVDEHGEDGRVGNASPLMPAPTAAQQAEMARHEATMRQAEQRMATQVAERSWQTVNFNAFAGPVSNSIPATNRSVALVLDAAHLTAAVISNAAGGKPFLVSGGASNVSVFHNTAPAPALLLDGKGHLRSDGLPKVEKGWAFAAWVRRDATQEAALFSTAKFKVPASSQSYGEGVEIRLTTDGAVDVRLARRWPAYSLNIVTRDLIRTNQWRHLLVTSDGGAAPAGLRVFLDGQEAFRDVVHDDLQGAIGINGPLLIGASGEPGSRPFIGAIAGVQLWSRVKTADALAAEARSESLRFAALSHLADDPTRAGQLRHAWLEQNDPAFAALAAEWRSARSALLAIERDAPSTMIMRELTKTRPTHVLFRGQYDQPREQVQPGTPSALSPWPQGKPANRLGLAEWLTDPRQPLTARVVVNRLWQSFFGTGIVKTVEDFGYQADWPSHPELLDWLAMEFMDSGWDVKKLVRLMVSSATYRQDSSAGPELHERDPENRLLARGPRQRLTAEMLRDQALAISGLLKPQIGGPPVFPYQPANLYKGIIVAADYPGTKYVESKGEGLYRRSLYTFWKRTVPHPTLATFDAPDREFCVARRLKTNTPLQALALMNDTIQVEASRMFAERIIAAATAPEDRLRIAFRSATARTPEPGELKHLTALLDSRAKFYREHPDKAKAHLGIGASKASPELDPAELAAYANVVSLILNLDETISRN